jgi:hypothetical protein
MDLSIGRLPPPEGSDQGDDPDGGQCATHGSPAHLQASRGRESFPEMERLIRAILAPTDGTARCGGILLRRGASLRP